MRRGISRPGELNEVVGEPLRVWALLGASFFVPDQVLRLSLGRIEHRQALAGVISPWPLGNRAHDHFQPILERGAFPIGRPLLPRFSRAIEILKSGAVKLCVPPRSPDTCYIERRPLQLRSKPNFLLATGASE